MIRFKDVVKFDMNIFRVNIETKSGSKFFPRGWAVSTVQTMLEAGMRSRKAPPAAVKEEAEGAE